MGMGGDTVQDVEIKLGGADASTPLSTGVVMNIVTPRGRTSSRARRTTVPAMDWNSDNTKAAARAGSAAHLSR